jgi:enoyl-CoA hydratase/carnithine racemase
MVRVERDKGVAVVRLDRGVINPINLEMVRKLAETLEALRADAGVTGVVLASASRKFFSMGFDLPELLELDRAGMAEFFGAFNEACVSLYTLAKPTIAAIENHAVAGGCILALCCDYRYIAEGRNLMGLNEIKLGVPVPYLAQCILQQVAGGRAAREVAYGGELHEPEELLKMGLVDRVLKPAQVLVDAINRAKELGAMSSEAFAAIKRTRTDRIQRLYALNSEEKEKEFLDCWFSEGTRPLLQEAMAKFKPKE